MSEQVLIGYASVSTASQTSLPSAWDSPALVSTTRVNIDYGLTGTNCERPGLREALAACRKGHMVYPKGTQVP